MKPDKEYVVVLLFDKQFQNVLLIRKNRPQWQAGKLNGPGGKVEPGETPQGAARRELFEETGLAMVKELTEFCTFRMPDEAQERHGWCKIWCYCATVEFTLLHHVARHAPTDEALVVYDLNNYPPLENYSLKTETVQTVPLLIHLAQAALTPAAETK